MSLSHHFVCVHHLIVIPTPSLHPLYPESRADTSAISRVKGQDTMSKMAAYNAGLYRQRTGTTGPQTRVPIADFLQNNGYVPVSASRASEGHNRGTTAELASILTPCPTNNHLNKGNVANPAPFADMTGDGSTSLPSSHDMNSVSSQSAAPCFPPIGRQISDSDGRPPAPSTQLKASNTPPSFANMTPDRSILPSIEGDGNGEVAALRKDVFQLRSVCHGALASNNSVRRHAHELEEDRSEVEGDQNGVINLGQRLSQLEGIIHAMQYTSMTTVVDRVVQLERAVDELKGKVGDGCEAEVAKMREVFGSLRESLVRVGSFL